MPAVALTDHGTLGGAVKFYRAAEEEGIKRSSASSSTCATDRHSRAGVKERNAHLTLLARDETGYKNLVKLSTSAYLEGYYYKPRADWELLSEHHEGLIALTGCMSGKTSMLLRDGDDTAALAEVRRLAELLGPENVYVELQDAGLPEQRELLPSSRSSPRRPASGWWPPTTSTTCATRTPTRTTRSSASRRRQHRRREPHALRQRRVLPQVGRGDGGALPGLSRRAATNTVEIAARCDVAPRTSTSYTLPTYPVPDGSRGQLSARPVRAGHRAPLRRAQPDRVLERLDFELGVIGEMGFVAYFLIVWDFVTFAKRQRHRRWDRGAARPPAPSWATRWASPTSTRSSTTCCSSGSSTPSASACPTSTSTSARTGGSRSSTTWQHKYGARPRGADHHVRHHGRAQAVIRDVGRVMDVPLRDGRRDRQADPRAGSERRASTTRIEAEPATLKQAIRRRRRGHARSDRHRACASRASSATTPSTPPAW